MTDFVKLESEIERIIKDLKGVCNQHGLGNQGDEERIITTVFLYKFLNDRFMYNLRKFADDTAIDYRTILKNDNLELDAFYDSFAGSVAFDYEDTIEYLMQYASYNDFYKKFDIALSHISTNPRNESFNIETSDGTRKDLFEKISNVVDESSRNNFIQAIFSAISIKKFEFGTALKEGQSFDFYSRIFEYLIKDYNVTSGKYAEYFTPQAVSNIIAKILVGMSDHVTASEIYDPSAGSGSLVLHLANELGKDKNISRAIVYTQDISQKSSRFLRINLLLNGLTDSLHNAIQGDTLLNPAHYQTEKDPQSGLKKFDYIVSNPPFKLDFSSTRDTIEHKWSEVENEEGMRRFFSGIPKTLPEKKDSMPIYLPFIQHILFSLKKGGKAAIIVPTGFLTAKAKIERNIREELINKKILKGVITMPKDIFTNTGTQVAVLFIDKSCEQNEVILVDASNLGTRYKEEKKKKTILSSNETKLIEETFLNFASVNDFSVIVPLEKVKNKQYSFAAGQYFNSEIERKVITEKGIEALFDGFSDSFQSLSQNSPINEKKMKANFESLKYIETPIIYNKQIEKNIPQGWKVVTLGSCIERIATGLNPRDNFKLGKGDIKYVTVKNLNLNGTIDFASCDTVDNNAYEKIHKRSDIKIGDILFASIAPLGRCYLISEQPVGWDINESVFSIRPNLNQITAEYLYMFLTSEQFIKNAEESSTGSIFKGIRISTLQEMLVAIPPKDQMAKISLIIKDVLNYKSLVDKAAIAFNQMNKSLFPLLMEGQIIVEQK